MNIQDIVVEIDAEISKLQQIKALLAGISTTGMWEPGRPANTSFGGRARTRRKLSAEAREKIAAAQRARWAKTKKAAKKATTAGLRAKSKKRRTLSAGARAKIAAAQKARWAKVRKAAKKTSAAKVAKKSAPAKKPVSVKRAGASKTESAVAPKTPARPVTAAS